MQQNKNKKMLVIVPEDVLLCTASGGVKPWYEPSYRYGTGMTSYPVFLRPHLNEFLNFCHNNFRVALWSESSPEFIQDALQRIYGDELTPDTFEFIWYADKCVPPSDGRYNVEGFVHRHKCKSFDKILEAGYTEDEIIILDVNDKHWEPVYSIPSSCWLSVLPICKMFGNIAIGGEEYSPEDSSILDVIEELRLRTA
jgi:hypothetical protein